jgi:hypothetical protein
MLYSKKKKKLIIFSGKTMENVFNRKNYKIINPNNIKQIVKLTKSNKFKKEFHMSKNITIIESEKKEIIFTKPIYIGFTILEHSKLYMYKLHYDVIKGYYGNNATLMYMDTDSLIYNIFTKNIDNDHKLLEKYIDIDKKGILGKLKDEYPLGIKEFLCIKSKCYAIKTNDIDVKKCKGIKKIEVNNIKFDDYYKCLYVNNFKLNVNQLTFKSINHQLFTILSEKTALTNIDDKRLSISKILTVPHGYERKNNLNLNI